MNVWESIGQSVIGILFSSVGFISEHSQEWIVKVDSMSAHTQSDPLRDFLKYSGVVSARYLRTESPLIRVQMNGTAQTWLTVSRIQKDSRVEYIEPNYPLYAASMTSPNDPRFRHQWALQNTQSKEPFRGDIHVAPLWQRGLVGSKKIIVAVIDSGVDIGHPDLAENIFINSLESPGSGRDDDGNGFVDDIHGWSIVDDSPNVRDDLGHGTHVAGSIGAVGNNRLGIVGVSWQLRILPIKILNNVGSGTYADAIEALSYAKRMGANIINNSYYGTAYSQAFEEVIESLNQAGILFVACSGNAGANNEVYMTYPANSRASNVLSVGSTDSRDQLSSFSNWSSTRVHLLAPGENILSTVPRGGYAAKDGTSMAAPHVSGAAALLWASRLESTVEDIRQRLLQGSDPVVGLRNKSVSGGRLNVLNAYEGMVVSNPDPAESLWQRIDYEFHSPHPYPADYSRRVQIRHPGAKYLRLNFERIELRHGDRMILRARDSHGNWRTVDNFTGAIGSITSEYVLGDEIELRVSAPRGDAWGIYLNAIEVVL